ncbi:hypothetical protein QWY77_07070 [Thalassotalea ponticola]|uniref:hypothetical protein n=1 Tax=Thalassotalea ponticola TaxID=1523392 RepID=UPI0025B322E9|nr:hypothetical protein [Thalassotalea ponticola]MDN3652525.1 hypothetical protein [Thalassotalea ponticola]
MRTILILVLLATFSSAACELTVEYRKARIKVRADIHQEYRNCDKAAKSDAYYKAVSICKAEGRGKNIAGGCFHIVGYELVTTKELTAHCEIFKPKNGDLDRYLEYYMEENSIQKCKPIEPKT